MKSIEINVPRNLIKKFYPHPEAYGDGNYVVDLINDMYTDVFYREEGDFVSITNDEKLISYLRKNQVQPRDYFFRNGVFSFRNLKDYDNSTIEEWKKIFPKIFKIELKAGHGLPSLFMFCFYWIEIGIIKVKENSATIEVFENELIDKINIDRFLDMLKNMESTH